MSSPVASARPPATDAVSAVGPSRATTWPPMTYWAKVFLTLAAVGLACLAAYQLRAVAVSVALALFLAIGLDPAVAAMTRRGLPRGAAVLALLVGLFSFLGLFFFLAIPPAVSQFSDLIKALPTYFQQLTESNPKLNELINGPQLQEQLSAALGKVPSLISSSVDRVFGVASAVIGGIFSFITVLVLMIYFQLSLPKLRARAEGAAGSARRVDLLREVLGKISGYVVGQLSICFIAGFLAYIFLTIIQAPFPALLGLLTAITAAVPLVGATIGAVLVTIVVLTDSVPKAIATAIFYLVYQQIENYVIAPRVFSRAINLPPAVVFVAVLAGSALGGVLGAIVALPVAAAIKSVWIYRMGTDEPDADKPAAEPPPAKSDPEPTPA